MNYIKSPLNYTGGKYKLLPQILPLLPNNIDTFIDLFGGGMNVAININANKIVANDINTQVIDLMKYLQSHSTEQCYNEIMGIISKYNLSKENKEGYLALREHYNKSQIKNDIEFYTLICYSFSNQIRFNRNNEFNMPFGKDRSDFNKTLQEKFIVFCNELHNKNISFLNYDFRDLKIEHLGANTFVYIDSPYLNSVATYNEQGGWNEQDEKDLLDLTDKLTKRNVKFALSNNLKYNNKILKNWMTKYNVYSLNGDYSNCNYHKKDKTAKGQEILVTNYKL